MGTPYQYVDGLFEYINTLEGATLTDKFYTYCHTELGLSTKEIADFRQKMLGTVYPADVKNLVNEATTSLDLSAYTFEAEALTDNMPSGSNLLVTVAPESGITGQNIINDGVCQSLVLTDGADFGTPNAFTATQVSFTTNVKSYKTLVLPFEAAVPTDFTAASAASATGSKINLENVTTISANAPVLVQGEGALELTATNAAISATPEEAPTNGVLCGTYKAVTAPLGSYVLQKQNDVIGFYHVEDAISVGAFRAWLDAPASSVKAFYLGDDATGLSDMSDMSDQSDIIFNLAGQRIGKMKSQRPKNVKGVYVVGGKKVLF